ncbi:PREDICTED: pectinesterase inhibitor-like [Camelina sativa]|uniref:Pectinesterase inhibitor-like n=1 Tax=Camelina sativa TaxID=90675 RepID=A0ABM0YSA1_CAMSA|nr:PREDICTED: pectinesterase inhibitor-like [Camelina sativa]
MAFPCVKRNVLSVLPLLLLLSVSPLSSSLSPSDKVTNESLNQLCSKPGINRPFCIFWLADPKTFTLDLNGLLGLVIEKTRFQGNTNLALIKSEASFTTDPPLKIPYGTCTTYYEPAIKLIEEAIGFASSKNYQLTSLVAAKAFKSITVCDAALAGRHNVPIYVPQHNLDFERMCNIVRVLSDVLRS